MGTSIENTGGDEGVEEEVIPWSCVDEVIRQKLIQRLNPEQIMSGNNWRGLAGRLGYTTAEIMTIESDKGVNTRVFFNDYDFKKDNSFNEVYQCLKEMERNDCVSILDSHKSKIKENFENEKRLLQNSIGHHSHHPHQQHSVGASCGGCSCSMQHNSSMPHRGGPPQQHMCYPSCNSSHPSHNCFNHGAYQSNSCYHMPPSHPLQMPSGCMASCSNHSSSKNCPHMCSQQSATCLPPHLQMDINSTIPKCSPLFHQPPPPHTSALGHHPSAMAFSDRPHAVVAGATPNSYQYYNGRNPSYSPRVSPENNNKPFNFSVSGSGSYTTGVESNRPMSREEARGSSDVMNQSGQSGHSIEQQPNNLFSKAFPLPDNISPQPNSDVSNENNMSVPTSLTNQYYDTNKLPSQHSYQSGSQGATALPIDPPEMDSKKSLHLQKLTEISKVPNQYQPTDEYKTVVAEQKIENKRQRGRNTRGNGSIISSSSGNSTASSSSSSSGPSGAQLPRSQPATVPEELRPMAELSIRKSPSVPNNLRPEPDSRAISSKVFVTYSRDSEDHKFDVLRLSFFLRDNDISMYADVATDPSAMADTERNLEPYQDYYSLITLYPQGVTWPAPYPAVLNTRAGIFGSGRKGKQADFILVCISPKYLEDISGKSPPSSSPTTVKGSGRPIHTREIYQMMKEEHLSRVHRNKSRFVSLLFGGMSADQMPDWLKKHYPVYQWPSEYENIGWFLKKPKERICAQPFGKNYQ